MNKIALISDIHFGVKKSSEKFLNTQVSFFENVLIPTIKSNNIDHLFILGDLFDNPLETNVLVKNIVINIFNTLINKFPKLQIKILTGNHDIYYKTTLETSSLAIFNHFPQIEIIKTIKPININGIDILCVPWLVKDSFIKNEFLKLIDDNISYDLCFGHFEVNQFEIIPSVYEQKGLPIEAFKNFKYVYSGHFHIRNTIQNVNYLGSPYEITWNDYGNSKGITLIDISTFKSEFIENTISPKHLKINLSSVIKDKNILKNIKNNFIKFYWDVQLNADKKLDLEEKINKMGALELTYIDDTFNNTLQDQTDSVDISENIQGSPIVFLNSYYNEIKHPDNIDATELKLMTNELYINSLKD